MGQTKIIGIAGTNGAGKDTVGKILTDDYHFLFVSVTDLLRAELRRQGKEVIRQNTSALSAEWRRELGLAVLIDKVIA
ncbi:MAG: AAA family ATPase [Candidatus Saccharimonadales bacterium]